MRGSRRFFRLLLGTAIAFVSLQVHGVVNAAILIVPDGYPTIQAAIDAAAPGETIIVRAGTYFENVNLNKAVTLTAEVYDANNPANNTTIIDGGVDGLVATVTIPAGILPMPTIRGFVLRNGKDGIYLRSESIIEYNFFLAGGDQIDYSSGGGGFTRHNVFLASLDDGIDLDNLNRALTIENNRMMYNGDDGIEMRLQDLTAPLQPITVTIRNNEIIGCDEDGIQIIDYSQSIDTNRSVFISGNLIANCRYAGIGLMPNQISIEDYSGADILEAIRVYNNTLYGNDYGISGGDNLVAFNNIIANTPKLGVWRVQGLPGANSVVAYSLFYNNGVDAGESLLGAGNLYGQNPLFASAPNPGLDGLWGTVDDDFSGLVLQVGSPAIDAGVASIITSDGEAVPPSPITGFSGLAPDLGWREFNPLPQGTATATATPSSTSTSPPPGFGTVISQVSASSDDAEETISSGITSVTSSDLELGAEGAVVQWVGMRFNRISIPRGAAILNAYVEFEVDETGSDPTSVTFYGQASDNAPGFTNTGFSLSSRTRTTAQAAWNSIPAWTILDAKWQSPNISPVIQEIVNRTGWVPGNSIVILVNGTGRRTAEAYDGEPPAAARLVIEYTTGNTPTPTVTPTSSYTPTPTRTPTPTPTPTVTLTPVAAGNIRFAVIGDYGNGGLAEGDVANLVKSWSPDLVITTGDNNYPLGEAATIDQNIGQFYHQFIYPYTGAYGAGAASNRFFPSLGNHDWGTINAQPYLDYFSLPGNERTYDFVWGPVHFFAIDSDPNEPNGNLSTSVQGLWLQGQLAASTSPWNIVYMHHPPYSSGATHGSASNLQWPYRAWGADAVLSGHDHTYERIVLDGFPYFVNGLGGKSIYAFNTPVPGSEVRYNGNYGAMLVEASSSALNFQFISRTGQVIDTYSLGAVPTQTPTASLTPTATGTSTPTPPRTFTSTPTGTATPTYTPTSSPTPASDLIFADGFESGGFSAWSSGTTDGNNLSVSSAAALSGNYGLQALINDNNTLYVVDEKPNTEVRYRARFYFDPNSITMANNNTHALFQGYSGASTLVLRLEFRFFKGNYQVQGALCNDSGSWTNTSWFTISNATHFIELDWRAATSAGANNGGLTFWIDSAQRASLTGIDNDTRRIDSVRLGAVSGLDNGTRGTYYFDAFESRRQTYIGP